jgi:sulfite exporter TauE/SafE
MHCPNCGKPADADQQFCRACGMRLETVGRLVAEHTSTELPERKSSHAELERQIVGRMFSWITWGMIILGIGVVILVFNKSFSIGNWLRFISTVICLLGVGVATAGLLKAMKQGVSISGKKPVDQISGPAKDTNSLPTRPIPASLPSVTERTTQLLPTDDGAVNNAIDSKRRE